CDFTARYPPTHVGSSSAAGACRAAGSEVAMRKLEGHRAKVFALAFSPDGRTLASGGGRDEYGGVSRGARGEGRLWDVAAGRQRAELRVPKKHVYSAAFSPDGKVLATGDATRTVRLWHPATGAEQRTLRLGHTRAVLGLAFSPDGKLLVSGAG